MAQLPQAHNHGKYDNNGKGWYFRFDNDNKRGYKYILSYYSWIIAIYPEAYTEVAENYAIVSIILLICMLTTGDFRIPLFCNPIRDKLKHGTSHFLKNAYTWQICGLVSSEVT